MSDASGAPAGGEGQGQGGEGSQQRTADLGQQQQPPGHPPAQDNGNDDADPASLREALTAARQADRTGRQRVRQLEAELTELRRGSMSEQEKAVTDAVTAARAEIEQEWAGRYLTLRLERLAATMMADPADAPHLLDMSDIAHDTPDATIVARLTDLLKAKPYLAAKGSTGLAPAIDRGPQNGQPKGGGTDMNALLRERAR